MEIFGVSSLLLTNFVSISELTLPSTILVISENQVKTTRENGWLALRLKASATGRGLKAYRMVSLQHHLC